jgi:hypothetical protein
MTRSGRFSPTETFTLMEEVLRELGGPENRWHLSAGQDSDTSFGLPGLQFYKLERDEVSIRLWLESEYLARVEYHLPRSNLVFVREWWSVDSAPGLKATLVQLARENYVVDDLYLNLDVLGRRYRLELTVDE